MKSVWKFWSDAASVKNASGVLQRFEKQLGVPCIDPVIEPYHKGGHVVTVSVDHDVDDWKTFVFDVILLGQGVARSWTLMGDVSIQVDAWSSDSSVSGVSSVQWICDVQYQS